MDPNRWRQIDDLFSAVVDCAPAERNRLLDRRCGDDSGLREELETLLAAHERSSHIIDSRAFEVASRTRTPRVPHRLTGQTIGHYRILSFIGAGGAGAVYEAEQDNPRRIIALKLMRALPYRDELTARLVRREGQALARLQHPGIAAIYEAGQSEDGWHYFAMERVEGKPLTIYAQENGLSNRDRLELFARVCDTVHYAHQRGVIHRDLKPSNILVTQDGQPKILDFGLARVTDPDADMTQITQAGAFQGTPAYASPEQTRGRSDDIDVRSDVYSLGVILYELLTRTLPYQLAGLTLSEAGRVICEKAPHQASTIDRSLRGDLETITRKALEKEPDRRYGSAAALGEDISRFLLQQPILAHPPSAIYQFRKFTRRHRGLVVAITSILLLLAGSSVWMSVLYARALRAEKRAQDEARQAELKATKSRRVTDFLKGMFGESDPNLPSTRDLTADELLNRDVERIHAELGDQPEVQGELLEVLAMVFLNRGNLDRTVELHEAGLKYRAKVYGDPAPEIAASMANLGSVLFDLDRFREAEKYDRLALDIFRSNYGMENYFSATVLSNLARVISERDPAAAEPMNREALKIFQKIYGENNGTIPRSKQYLAETLDRLGRYEESERLCREAIAFLGEDGKVDQIRFIRVQRDLASTLMHQHRYEEARTTCRSALDACNKMFGASPHIVYGEVRCMHAAVEEAAGDFPQARAAYENALSMARAVHHNPHLDLADALSGKARSLVRDGETSAAVPLFEESLAIRRKLLDPPDPRLAQGLRDLADALRAVGRIDEAGGLNREESKMLATAGSS